MSKSRIFKKKSSGAQRVNYVGDHGGNGRQTGFDEGGGKRIELTGGGLDFMDEFRDGVF